VDIFIRQLAPLFSLGHSVPHTEQEVRIMSDSDRAWKKWGDIDPYFGVLTDPKFRKDAIADNKDAFFDTGETHVRTRLEKVEGYFGTIARRRALDFGCGVGRLVFPLAAQFEEVVGVDISQGMLAEAVSTAEARGLNNTRFVLSDDALTNVTGVFDFVHTYIVLQHIPVDRGLGFMAQLLDKVAPGGGLSLHFPIDRKDSLLTAVRYWAQRKVPGVPVLANLVSGRPWDQPPMQMNAYPLPKVLQMLEDRGFGDVTSELEDHFGVVTVTLTARRGS
jgi:2-polyprenyl-3-methyl-5-hydroxy-6-metoxy-1,4-benzoquinol methylase